MWEMLKSVVTGTRSTKVAEDYFQDICMLELDIDQIKDTISRLETELTLKETNLDFAYAVYSQLKIK